MLDRLHHHLTEELQRNARIDTIAIITAIAFNLVVLGINSAVAAAGYGSDLRLPGDLVLVAFFFVTFLVNGLAVLALITSKLNSTKIMEGLLEMYRDNEVDKYFNPALLTGLKARYWLFIGIAVTLASASVFIPLIIRFV